MKYIISKLKKLTFSDKSPKSSFKKAIIELYEMLLNSDKNYIVNFKINFKKNETEMIINNHLVMEEEIKTFCNNCKAYHNSFYSEKQDCQKCKLRLFNELVENKTKIQRS